MNNSIIILGAGAIGVSAAWQLQQRGWHVCLIDRQAPASETSYGNAGIVSPSAAVPFNNPALLRQLPALIFGRSAALHCRISYLAANLPWCLQYLRHCTAASSLRRAKYLHQLILRGQQLHQDWLAATGHTRLIKSGGWLKLYRSRRSFARAAAERALWDQLAVEYRVISAEEINTLMPCAQPVFAAAVLIKTAYAVVNPAAAIRAYADAFIAGGGDYIKQEAVSLQHINNTWQVQLKNAAVHKTKHLVIALGPWSRQFLKPLGIKLPMVFERGAHRHFTLHAPPPPLAFTDIDGGYSAVMQENSLRMTSGVYFASLAAPPPQQQLTAAEKNLRQAIREVGSAAGADWYGARPTMPDSLPVIGQCRRRGLWLAGGNQHIGLMSAPATGECVAQLINDETPTITAGAFSPARFGI